VKTCLPGFFGIFVDRRLLKCVGATGEKLDRQVGRIDLAEGDLLSQRLGKVMA
jgi:hypothetical protein